jgi:hypothetical protein
MMEFAVWLKGTSFSLMLQNVLWMVPAIQTIHILGIAVLTVSVTMIALRVIGASKGAESIEMTQRRLRPWTWAGLVVLVLTGTLLFIEEPDRLLADVGFQIKMALLVLAIPATWASDSALRSAAPLWRKNQRLRTYTQALSVTALGLWLGVVIFGRWIAYLG